MNTGDTLISIVLFTPLAALTIFIIMGTLSMVAISKTTKGFLDELKKIRELLERQKG